MTISKKSMRLALWTATAGTALCLAAAPPAVADPILPVAGNGSASDAVTELQAAGYDVSINFLEGTPNVPLSECRTQSISGVKVKTTADDAAMMLMDGNLSPVSIDVNCPNAK